MCSASAGARSSSPSRITSPPRPRTWTTREVSHLEHDTSPSLPPTSAALAPAAAASSFTFHAASSPVSVSLKTTGSLFEVQLVYTAEEDLLVAMGALTKLSPRKGGRG